MKRRRALLVGLGALALALVACVLGFGPVVRAQAKAQAERRGATLEAETVRPGWGRVWLRDVEVRIAEVPAVEIHASSLEVRLSGLTPSEVRVHGGAVRVRGSPSEVLRQVEAWRAKRSSSGSGRSTAFSADGLAVTWSELELGAEPAEAWGLAYRREGERERLSVDLARGRFRGLSGEVRHASLDVGRRDGRRVIERLVAEGLSATVDLQSEAVRRALPEKPTTELAKHSSRPARPDDKSWPTVRFLDAERGPRLRRSLAGLSAAIAEVLPPQGELDLSGLALKLVRGKDSLNVGPGRLRVVRGAEGVSISLVPAPAAEQALRLSLELPEGPKDVKASVAGGPVTLSALGVQEGDFGLRDLGKATFEAQGTATLSADGRELAWVGSTKLDNVAVEKDWLAPGIVRGLSLGLRGKGRFALDGSRVAVDDGELTFGKVRIELAGVLEQNRDWQKIRLSGGVPLASCQAMLDSTPEGLAPLLAGMRASGTFSLTGEADIDSRNVEKMVTRWSVANECRITDVPLAVSPRKFAQSWSREVLDATGRPTLIQSGPGTPGWVPFMSISKHMETAVLICEDANYHRHRGFDHEAIRNSIRENVKARRFVRGASTLSMQLAKNLYLTRTKTLSRKLQEAVLTQLLEQELSKDQILELYLNVVEFGPGIYGIGPAAAHYFNTSASQLSLGQALYLASVLPSPKRHYFGADGAVGEGWMGYLRKLMRIALKIRRINESELEEALGEQVTFGKPHSPRVPVEGETAEGEGEPTPPLESEQPAID